MNLRFALFLTLMMASVGSTAAFAAPCDIPYTSGDGLNYSNCAVAGDKMVLNDLTFTVGSAYWVATGELPTAEGCPAVANAVCRYFGGKSCSAYTYGSFFNNENEAMAVLDAKTAKFVKISSLPYRLETLTCTTK